MEGYKFGVCKTSLKKKPSARTLCCPSLLVFLHSMISIRHGTDHGSVPAHLPIHPIASSAVFHPCQAILRSTDGPLLPAGQPRDSFLRFSLHPLSLRIPSWQTSLTSSIDNASRTRGMEIANPIPKIYLATYGRFSCSFPLASWDCWALIWNEICFQIRLPVRFQCFDGR